MTEKEGLPYELVLTDLAGATSLATRGTGMRELPESWSEDFVLATTTPETLYPDADKKGAERVQQDAANKQNLLLLLSRGHWSVDFLKTATSAYWDLDTEHGQKAWPGIEFDESLYAPAPSGVYLTDGMVALTAALTANEEASRWAFDEFQPGTSVIEGSDYEVGDFTYHLVFEHEYPEGEEGRDIGMAATLTALAAATETDTPGENAPSESQAAQDSETLTAFAQDVKAVDEGSCTWLIYDCIVMAAKAVAQLAQWVWERVGHWGHFALDILSMTTFAPPPFMFIGVGAAASNAGWYAIEGDYVMAGISLATAVPGLAFTKLAEVGSTTKAGAVVIGAVAAAQGSKVGKAFQTAAMRADKVSRQAKAWLKGSNATAKDIAKDIAEGSARTVTTANKAGYRLEKEFQEEIAEKIPGSKMEEPLVTNCKDTCTGNRRVDIYHEKSGSCIEVKTGIDNPDYAIKQEIQKDLRLLKSKKCKSVSWVFGPDKDGVVGPSKALREALQKAGIPYDIVKAAA